MLENEDPADESDEDQGAWDEAIGEMNEGTKNQFIRATIESAAAARSTRASLSQSAQDLLGNHIPESFLAEVYPRDFKNYDRACPNEITEIRNAMGANAECWDFGTMSLQEINEMARETHVEESG